jgi:hypothetical protein
MEDPLMGSGSAIGGSGLLSGSGLDSSDTKERTGVGIFDADELEDGDPMAMTQMADDSGTGFELDALGGSGSGLMDLTRESDDTSLGADFLEEVGTGDSADMAPEGDAAGALFEGDDVDSDSEMGAVGVAAAPMVAAERIEGGASGFLGGMSLGAAICMMVALAVLAVAILGAPMNQITGFLTQNMMITLAGMAGVVLVMGGLGWVAGKSG